MRSPIAAAGDGHRALQNELTDLLAAFPDGSVQVRDFACLHSHDLGLHVAAIRLLRRA